VYDAHAALALAHRFGEKAGDFLVRFVAGEAVQVDMVADRPPAPPQVTQYAARQARTQVGVGLADGQEVVDFERPAL
jgi:hypothetical protein